MVRRGAVLLSMLILISFAVGCTQTNEQPNIETPSEEAQEPRVETIETDIVVVGAGLAGASTAISALQKGKNVILVDSGKTFGQNFRPSFGNFLNAMLDENKDYHLTDSTDTLEAALERWKVASEVGNNMDWQDINYELVEKVLIESAVSIDWMENLGIEFEPSFNYIDKTQDVAKVIKQGAKTEGALLMDAFERAFDILGGKAMLNFTAVDLITDRTDRVIGVQVEGPKKSSEIIADQVVLATGGYGASPKMLEENIPNLKTLGYHYSGGMSSKGDGLKLIEDVGGQKFLHQWIVPSIKGFMPHREVLEIYPELENINLKGSFATEISNSIIVDSEGKRFTDESSGRSQIVADMIDYAQDGAYLLISKSQVDKMLENIHVDKNRVYYYEDYKNIREFPLLEETISNYNNLAAGNINEPEPTGKDIENIRSIPTEKFYLISIQPDIVSTLGGVVTNEDQQVLDEKDVIIGGLYAVGEITNKDLFNRAEFANVNNSAAVTLGRLLGEKLATGD